MGIIFFQAKHLTALGKMDALREIEVVDTSGAAWKEAMRV